MSSLSFDAAKLRYALILRATNVNSVVEWADSRIEQLDNPPIELIEISMGRTLPVPNMLAHLLKLITDGNSIDPMCAALGMLVAHIQQNEIDAESVIPDVYQLLQAEKLINDDPFLSIPGLDSGLSLIRDGICSTDDLPRLRSATISKLLAISLTQPNA